MAKTIKNETIINKISTFCQFAHLIAPKGYLLEAKMQASNSKDATINNPIILVWLLLRRSHCWIQLVTNLGYLAYNQFLNGSQRYNPVGRLTILTTYHPWDDTPSLSRSLHVLSWEDTYGPSPSKQNVNLIIDFPPL